LSISLSSAAGPGWLANSDAIPSRPAPFLPVQEQADFSGANAAEATLHP
jgi:hypothetical protein